MRFKNSLVGIKAILCLCSKLVDKKASPHWANDQKTAVEGVSMGTDIHYHTLYIDGDRRQRPNKVWDDHWAIGHTCRLHVAHGVGSAVSALGFVIFCQLRLSCRVSLVGAYLTSPHRPATLLTQIYNATEQRNTRADVRGVMLVERHSSTALCVCVCKHVVCGCALQLVIQ